ncbi:MAG TPA: superoxide dismutase [Candidatus Nanoarchaeia archaeon]|nr:superoxide dismutase [Candidatus Nanoarchaeia archaeon]
MTYNPLNFDNLIGAPGLSDKMLKDHFTLYQGYVTNTNKCADLLMALFKDGKTATPEFAEVKRRFGWEFNGMRLHELYFGNMHREATKLDEKSAFAKAATASFGSIDKLKEALTAVGTMRGIGWAVLYYDSVGEKMFVNWVNEHDVGHLAGCAPLLIMDVFEHAYMTDYQLKRADYIKAFVNAINWPVVAKRFDQAKKI